jgi:hypothetical protein
VVGLLRRADHLGLGRREKLVAHPLVRVRPSAPDQSPPQGEAAHGPSDSVDRDAIDHTSTDGEHDATTTRPSGSEFTVPRLHE